MFFHVDANSFYASCERLFRPDLDEKPIAVLSNNDGITIALNQECKNLGFKRGDTYFKMKNLYEANNVAVFSSNYTLYADISMRLNTIYNQYSEDVEFYSIDESFLYFPDWRNVSFSDMGKELLYNVQKGTHIPVSIGIAPTKTLAKLCNKLAKNRGGVCCWNELDGELELSQYPVGEVWGIGRSKTKILSRIGIKTALDLKRLPLDLAKKYLTVTGFNTVRELNGISAIRIMNIDTRQNITSSRSFAHGVADMAELETALSEYTQLAVTRMRSEKTACRYVMIYLMTARAFSPENKSSEYFNGATMELDKATSFLPDILSAAIEILHSLYKKGFLYRKIMVNLLGLEPDFEIQGELFEPDTAEQRKKKSKIMSAYDAINTRYGRGTLHIGIRNQTSDISKTGGQASWITNRNLLSPRYTTRFSDLPEVLQGPL